VVVDLSSRNGARCADGGDGNGQTNSQSWRDGKAYAVADVIYHNLPLRIKRATLFALQGAGLIKVEWKPGCNPIVAIKMDEDCAPAHQ